MTYPWPHASKTRRLAAFRMCEESRVKLPCKTGLYLLCNQWLVVQIFAHGASVLGQAGDRFHRCQALGKSLCISCTVPAFISAIIFSMLLGREPARYGPHGARFELPSLSYKRAHLRTCFAKALLHLWEGQISASGGPSPGGRLGSAEDVASDSDVPELGKERVSVCRTWRLAQAPKIGSKCGHLSPSALVATGVYEHSL